MEMESAHRPPLQLSHDVAREKLRLTLRTLCRRGTWLPSRCVCYRGAITDSPHTGLARHRERAINNECTPLVFFQRERLQQGIRRGASGPDQSLSANLAIAQENDPRSRIYQARVQAKRDPAQFHLLLRIPGKRFAQFRQDAIVGMNQYDV